jgi:hypothetical protein
MSSDTAVGNYHPKRGARMIPIARVQREESATARCASKGTVPATLPCFSGASRQAAQTGHPARPQPSRNRRASQFSPSRPELPGSSSPEGYVEDCNEPRTKLGKFSGVSRQAAQTDYPARPQPKNRPEAYPLGYVEDLFEVRTQLGVCFSSLPAGRSKRLSG